MASSTPIPIIDSHIHLYPEAELDSLAWYTPDSPLGGRHSVDEFRAASASAATSTTTAGGSSPGNGDGTVGRLAGFVFVETDRRNGGGRDWAGPLAEVAWAARLVTGRPRPGEGHAAADAPMCLAVVPWAPLPLGADELEGYLARVEETAGPEAWGRVRGFRYLLQDKPLGVGLGDGFVEGLKVLGRRGFAFDVGVDQHRRGRAQLEECVEMIDRAHEGVPEEEKVVFIINHLCKPDLTIINFTSDASFIAWRTAMFTLSKCSKTYMKLSGGLAELPESLKNRSAEDIFEAMYPWLAVVLAAFGPSRIMFGSDWPVCTVGVGDGAWEKWKKIVERTCYMASLSHEDQAMIWGGTTKKAYGIKDD